MSGILISESQDHALLAYVIKCAREAIERKNARPLGRTAMQKIPYFLQVLGVPMKYRFEIYTYGPFCSEILRDIEWLEADGVITDSSVEKEKRSDYRPGEALDELLAMHRAFIDNYKDVIENVASGLAVVEPNQLELLATLVYLYRWFEATDEAAPFRSSVVARLGEIKPDKFTQANVDHAYDWLKTVGLVGE